MGNLSDKAKDMMNDAENKAHELKGQAKEKMNQAKNKSDNNE